MRYLIIISLISFLPYTSLSQGCCAGGASSPLAGGAASGVLQQNQIELSLSYQLNQSNTFFSGDTEVEPLFKNLSSNYIFFRTDYGLTKKLTISLATGFYLDKSLTQPDDKIKSSKGLADFIIFPRYSVYNNKNNFKRTEITLGLGIKIPLGTHEDSTLVYSDDFVGDIYSLNPPSVQVSSGSNDFMFYSFFLREYQKRKLRIFMTTLYVNKGFNSLGVKFGNYSSIGFFVSKTFFRKWGVTTQIKAERIRKITAANNIDLEGFYSINQESTGSKKWFFIPQLSYSHNGVSVFLTSQIPLYQFLQGTQVGSQQQVTFGVSYRFLAKKPTEELKMITL